MNILFVLAVILLVATIYRGWSRGLIGLVYGIASWLFIGIFILVVNPVIYNGMYNNPSIHDAIYDKVYPYIDKKVPGYTGKAGIEWNTINAASLSNLDFDDIKKKIENGEITVSKEYKELIDNVDTDKYKDIINNIDLSEYENILDDNEITDEEGSVIGDALVKALSDAATDTANEVRKSVVEATTERVCQYIIRFIAILITYLVAKAIAVVAKKLLNEYFEEGTVGKIVHGAGAVLGAVEGILYIWIFMYVISMIRMLEFGEKMYGYIQQNLLLKLLYENNLLGDFLAHL